MPCILCIHYKSYWKHQLYKINFFQPDFFVNWSEPFDGRFFVQKPVWHLRDVDFKIGAKLEIAENHIKTVEQTKRTNIYDFKTDQVFNIYSLF